MTTTKKPDFRTEREPLHKVLRATYRHFSEFEALFAGEGEHVIDHGYWVYNEDGTKREKVTISISLFDLKKGLKPQDKGGVLSDRKLQAVLLNVVMDLKQKDAAKIMGITTVSVGQYVEQAMKQLAEDYFSDAEKISHAE